MHRTELINFFIDQRNYKRYLEIGVDNEYYNFAYIHCEDKIGVDPKPVTTFCGTSDQFFAINKDKFDIIFIDGLHTEEQTLNDIANAFLHLSEGGIIILHDCMPPDAWHQRELEEFQEGEVWNGTVWKAALRVFNQTEHKCTLLETDWGCAIIDTAQKQTPLNKDLPPILNYEQHYPLLLEYRSSVVDYVT